MEQDLQQSFANNHLQDTDFNYEIYKEGFNFMFLFSAFMSAQNLVVSLFSSQGYDNLGLVSLLVIYATYAIFSLFTNIIISRLQYKYIFALSSLGYVSFTASGIQLCACDGLNDGICSKGVIYAFVLLGSFLCGFSASLIWVAQGGYINLVSINTPQKKGTFSGIFWAIMQSSQIFGAIIGSFILQYMENMSYFLIMTAWCLVGSLLFLFQPDVKNTETTSENIISIKTQMNNVYQTLFHIKTRYTLLLMMLAGIIISFYSGFLSNLVANSIDSKSFDENEYNQEISRKLSFILICLGCFEVISGVAFGYFGDQFNVYKLATFGTILCLIGIFFSFLGLITQNYFICFIIASIWGFSDCYFQSVIQTLLIQDFEGEIEIYQVFQFVYAMTCAAFYIINIILQNSSPYIFLFIILVFTVATKVSCSKLGSYKQTQQLEIQEDIIKNTQQFELTKIKQ